MAETWPDAALIEKFLGDLQPEATHSTDPARDIRVIGKVIAKNLPPPSEGKNKFLDVNAGRGYAAMAAKNMNYDVTGLNQFDYMHRFAESNHKNVRFLHSTLQDYARTKEKADAIVCGNIFSEQIDLESFTAALSTVLAPGGTVYIEEYNGNHLNTPRDVSGWRAIEPPMTTSMPSKKGLTALLQRHGLEVQKSSFTWAPYMRLRVGHRK